MLQPELNFCSNLDYIEQFSGRKNLHSSDGSVYGSYVKKLISNCCSSCMEPCTYFRLPNGATTVNTRDTGDNCIERDWVTTQSKPYTCQDVKYIAFSTLNDELRQSQCRRRCVFPNRRYTWKCGNNARGTAIVSAYLRGIPNQLKLSGNLPMFT